MKVHFKLCLTKHLSYFQRICHIIFNILIKRLIIHLDCHTKQHKITLCRMEQRAWVYCLWWRRWTTQSPKTRVRERWQNKRTSCTLQFVDEPNIGGSQWSNTGEAADSKNFDLEMIYIEIIYIENAT